METIILIGTVLQGTAISLGMGASTLAIINFFVAIADGTIDATERKMMGIVYIILRVAMVMILTTFLLLLGAQYLSGNPVMVNVAQLTLIAVLYSNAALMTLKLMPSKFGPAIQAGTWYTLGGISAILPLALAPVSYGRFLIGYAIVLAIALVVVNGMMKWLRKK